MRSDPMLSVLLCTHNPRADYLNQTLEALSRQNALPEESHEIIIVDNASDPPLAARDDVRLPRQVRVVVEPCLGLTHARRRSFRESRGDILLYVDDDNILDPNYFTNALTVMRSNAELGAIGGKALPCYETPPAEWFESVGISLACRDLGPSKIEATWRDIAPEMRVYPECAPIGAGMVLRREAYAAYIEETTTDPVRLALGRRGQDLASGEDNDMVMTILRRGWTIAYRPELLLTHLIPTGRLNRNYLCRYAYSSNRTWVQVLGIHMIRPWSSVHPLTVGLRKVRAWAAMRPWEGPAQSVAWAGACGLIDGRARLAPIQLQE